MEIKITLDNLTVEEINLILAGLGKLSYDSVKNIIPRIQDQAQSQVDEQQKNLANGF